VPKAVIRLRFSPTLHIKYGKLKGYPPSTITLVTLWDYNYNFISIKGDGYLKICNDNGITYRAVDTLEESPSIDPCTIKLDPSYKEMVGVRPKWCTYRDDLID
jgi:hypothetical protein